jgi:hypothetical protein
MNLIDKIKALVKKETQTESDWQSYISLSIIESSDTSLLFSAEAKAKNKVELARLRKKFWDDPRSQIIDPARPATLDEPEPVKA